MTTMNTISMTRNLLRVAAITLLALTFSTATYLQAQDKPAAAAEQSPLAKNLVGTWILVGKPADVREAPAAGGRLLFLTGRHWNVTQANPKTGATLYHHGGTYTLTGDEYAETVEYANESTASLIKKSFKFSLKVEGDTLSKTGIGNPWTEVWQRVK